MHQSIALRVFQSGDQAAVRALVLDGLAEHWGQPADPSYNHDLDDIATTYASGTTLVAVVAAGTCDEAIVGTGTIVPRNHDTAEIVRMSVAAEWRAHGIGRELVEALIDTAGTDQNGGPVRRVVLETTATWVDAIRFYERCGFVVTHHTDGAFGVDVWFERMVSSASDRPGP